MNRRARRVPVTPADGECPDGLKAFAVTVTETFENRYIVYARDGEEASEIVDERCNDGKISPSEDPGSEYDRQLDAEEYDLLVTDLKPAGHVKWAGRQFPYWELDSGGLTARVATAALLSALCPGGEPGEYASVKARRLGERFAHFVAEGGETVDSVKELVFG